MLTISNHARSRAEEYNVSLKEVSILECPRYLKSAILLETRPNCRIFVIAKDDVAITIVKFHRSPTKEHLNVDIVL